MFAQYKQAQRLAQKRKESQLGRGGTNQSFLIGASVKLATASLYHGRRESGDVTYCKTSAHDGFPFVLTNTLRYQYLLNTLLLKMVWTDLHTLCASTDRTEKHRQILLKYLLQYPEEARAEAEDGSYPLHCLLKNDTSMEVVAAVVQAYPEACCMAETIQGYYPLHIACRHGCSPDVVEYIIKCGPCISKRRSRRFFLCCIEEWILLCRGRSLAGWTPVELARRLPVDHPQRQGILELLESYDD